MIYDYEGNYPETRDCAFIAESADIAGTVKIGRDASVWFNVSIRGDIAPVIIGEGSNVQDNSVIHVGHDSPALIGKGVTIGHAAIIHACTIEDDCLIGMGAIVLDGALIGRESIVGAGSLVTQNKEFPPRSLIIGSPAKAVRSLTAEEINGIRENAREYVELGHRYHRKEREN